MNELKLVIVGIAGRMGGEILSLAPAHGFRVTTGVVKKDGRPRSVQNANDDGPVLVDDIEAVDPNRVDVVIDFSQPAATDAVVRWCLMNSKPLVSGVTGLSEQQMRALKKMAGKVAVFWAPNLSIGVAVLGRMVEQLRSIAEFDFQIEEIHHAGKKDLPSGTALLLQDQLTQAVKKTPPVPVSIRGGGVSGIHRVFAMGEEEMLTLEHVAMGRRVFARGALNASQWLIRQKPGYYGMPDLLDRPIVRDIASVK